MTTELYVNHAKYSMAKMVRPPIESKTSKPRINKERPMDPPETVSYQQATLMYEYDAVNSAGKPCTVIAPLQVEGPVIRSKYGLMEKPKENGVESATLLASLDMTNAETAASVKPHTADSPGGFWDQLYQWCISFLFTSRDRIPSIQRFSRIEALEGVLQYPIIMPRDQNTGALIPGRNPSRYFNVMSYGKKGSFTRREASFKYPDLKEGETKVTTETKWKNYDWSMLKGVSLEIYPMFTFKTIYIGGGKASIQFEITSAIVLDIVRNADEISQAETMKKLSMDSAYLTNIVSRTAALFKAHADSQKKDDEKKEEKKEAVPTAVVAAAPATPLPAPTGAISSLPGLSTVPGLPGLSAVPGLPGTGMTPSMAAILSTGPTLPQVRST